MSSLFDKSTGKRLEEIKTAHAKRHENMGCTPETCHTEFLLQLLEETRTKIADAFLMLEFHRL